MKTQPSESSLQAVVRTVVGHLVREARRLGCVGGHRRRATLGARQPAGVLHAIEDQPGQRGPEAVLGDHVDAAAAGFVAVGLQG